MTRRIWAPDDVDGVRHIGIQGDGPTPTSILTKICMSPHAEPVRPSWKGMPISFSAGPQEASTSELKSRAAARVPGDWP